MQFDDDSAETQPGEDLTVSNSHGSMDLGPATYDSDHDGIADSVILGDDDHALVFTDTDHDGRVDRVSEYDASGAVVHTSGTAGGSGDAGDGSEGAHAVADFAEDASTGSAVGAGVDADQPLVPESTETVSGISLTADDGSSVGLGQPTIDLDQDGQADTAIVHNHDGSITGYTDRDGDGRADQITQIAQDGKVVIAVNDGDAGWHVAATGHVDAVGHLVADAAPVTDSTSALPGTGHADELAAVGSGLASADAPIEGDVAAATGPAELSESRADITFSAGGQEYDLGAPTADMDGDGIPDTVVTQHPNGLVVGYTDRDGDGVADQVTELRANGEVTIGALDDNGHWTQVATGHLGADGQFVPDAASDPAQVGEPV